MGWTSSCSQSIPTSSTTASTPTCGGRRSSLDPPKIEVRRLTYEVGGTEILAGVDALVPDGEITAVVGPSGAGKSTLLRAINRLVEPSSGEVYLDGEATGSLDPLKLRRRVGMVFQIPALFEASVEEALLYGARLAGRSAHRKAARTSGARPFHVRAYPRDALRRAAAARLGGSGPRHEARGAPPRRAH